MTDINNKGTGLLTLDITMENTRKKKTDEEVKGGEDEATKEAGKSDYWNRVADDAASGYMHDDDDDSILNEDQEPGDNERGDQESGLNQYEAS